MPDDKTANVFRDRIKEFKRVRASELKANPKNWRTHPEVQRSAIAGLFSEVGYAAPLIVREVRGSYEIIDGHLRADLAMTDEVPVVVLDVTKAEAEKLLVLFDPITELATMDREMILGLLEGVSSEDDAVLDLLHDIERKATVTIPDGGEPPEDRPEFGNDILITINATASAFEHIAETIRDWHGIDGINVDVAQ